MVRAFNETFRQVSVKEVVLVYEDCCSKRYLTRQKAHLQAEGRIS